MSYNKYLKNIVALSLGGALLSTAAFASASYDQNPPFSLSGLKKTTVKVSGKKVKAYQPINEYNVFVNYELGMHCVGFDMSYCCVIPPYNSIQAQAIKSGADGKLPKFISDHDNFKLYYYTKDNSYSEGNKMKYWNVLKDVDGNGRKDDTGDNLANYVWKHLFIYKDLAGTIPKGVTDKDRLYVGEQIKVQIDCGPTGQHMMGGYLEYAQKGGGNIVMTDTLLPPVKNLKIALTAEYVWDALGLPMTAFNDSTRTKSIRTIDERDFQPFQKSAVQLHDKAGKPILSNGHIVDFIGTSPVDIPNCYSCHSRNGVAAKMSRDEGLVQGDAEYNYWKSSFPDISEYMARLSEGSINILSLHDAHHGTEFLKDYDSKSSSNRLGQVGAVNCADCHGDNVSGNLQEPRRGVTGYKAVHAKPLTEAIHGFHLNMVPMPDAAGRDTSCQACHPTHFQDPSMNDDSNPYRVTDAYGNSRFADDDVRTAGGGCYLGRDAHTNPDVKPPFFLNEVGSYMLNEVSLKDENGKSVSKMRGLYCTNCHNSLAQELYRHDEITDGPTQTGKTLRNKSIKEVIDAIAGGDAKLFKNKYADPVTTGQVNYVATFYTEHKAQTLVQVMGVTKKDGKLVGLDLAPWHHKGTKEKPIDHAAPYGAASAGNDWWLSAAEPHCADCHLAPFVESVAQTPMGKYFPVDQAKKYSLFRFSSAHGNLACQSCHESAHGLYPTTYKGPVKTVDLTTHEAALQYSPDGKYAGPVTCAACHTVNKKGVPTQLEGTKYANDYWASVTLMHYMRSGDQKLPVEKLIKKFPYEKASKVVKDGWK
jgi:mono/diheme cytochrome c family protein